jgi:hypothetical protein
MGQNIVIMVCCLCYHFGQCTAHFVGAVTIYFDLTVHSPIFWPSFFLPSQTFYLEQFALYQRQMVAMFVSWALIHTIHITEDIFVWYRLVGIQFSILFYTLNITFHYLSTYKTQYKCKQYYEKQVTLRRGTKERGGIKEGS